MRIVYVCVLAVIFLTTGCAFNRSGIQGNIISQNVGLEDLKREDYSILGSAEGTATVKYIGLWPIPVFWVKGVSGKGIVWGGSNLSGCAANSALYNAIESVPEADGLISLRIKESGKVYGFWYKKTEVSVKGKAISINSDR